MSFGLFNNDAALNAVIFTVIAAVIVSASGGLAAPRPASR